MSTWTVGTKSNQFSFTSTVLSKRSEEEGIDPHEVVHGLILAVGLVNLVLTFFADDPPLYNDLTSEWDTTGFPDKTARFLKFKSRYFH